MKELLKRVHINTVLDVALVVIIMLVALYPEIMDGAILVMMAILAIALIYHSTKPRSLY